MQQYILPFLSHHNVLSIKGIGSFVKDQIEPTWLVKEQLFNAPTTTIKFFPDSSETTPTFLDFIEKNTAYTKEEVNEVINSLKMNEEIEIKGIGHLTKDLNMYTFIPTPNSFFKNIDAVKIIRNNVSHKITVGNHQVSNIVMQEYYDDVVEKPKKDNWFIISCILFLLVTIYIVFYFYFKQ